MLSQADQSRGHHAVLSSCLPPQVVPSWQGGPSYERSCTDSGTIQLLYMLSRLMMRHTKAQTVGGMAVSPLPPKTEEDLAGAYSVRQT